MKNEKTGLGWRVPEKVKNDFTEWCSENGFLVQNDCAGALVLWQYIPSAIREAAKRAAALGEDLPEAEQQFFREMASGMRDAFLGLTRPPKDKL